MMGTHACTTKTRHSDGIDSTELLNGKGGEGKGGDEEGVHACLLTCYRDRYEYVSMVWKCANVRERDRLGGGMGDGER